MKTSGLFSNSLCLMRVVLIVQSVQDILRAKSVIYYHYLLLSPSVDGMHACTYTSTLSFEYTYAMSSIPYDQSTTPCAAEEGMISPDIT